MKTMTWGEIKKVMTEYETKDDDPVYIDVVTKDDEDGDREGMSYYVEGCSFRCGGGLVELIARNDFDNEDMENFL